MGAIRNLPDIDFVPHDTAEIERAVVETYENIAGRRLAEGDPVRLFLLSLAAIIVQQRVLIDHSAKMNLLAYAAGNYLDHIGALVGCDRLMESRATTTLKFTLSAIRQAPTTIPAGTKVTAGDGVMFATDTTIVIPAGDETGIVRATAIDVGAMGNGYREGEINIIVDPVAFVDSVANTTLSEGGNDRESDDEYRSRIEEAPESFTTAGSTESYRYHAMSASSLISDVAVDSPAPGQVCVYPLLTGGDLPGQEIINAVVDKLTARDVRPLTDLVTVAAPTVVKYDIHITYYINTADDTNADYIRQEVTKAVSDFVAWTKAKIGRDINPTELYYRLRQAGVKRAEIVSPEFVFVGSTSVAIADDIAVDFGGFEDG